MTASEPVDAPLEYRLETDSWTGRWRGQSLDVTTDRFARRLDKLAIALFRMNWDDLGEEEYIHVLASAQHDLEFWGRAAGRRASASNTIVRPRASR